MRKLVLAAVVSVLVTVPATLRAEGQLVLAQQPAPSASGDGIDSNKMIAIGAGIVIGAAITSSAMMLRATTLLGAVAGGVIGAWWYNNRAEAASLDPRNLDPRKK